MTQHHPTDPVLGINLDAISAQPEMPLGTTAMGVGGSKLVYCYTADPLEEGGTFDLSPAYTATAGDRFEAPRFIPGWSFFWCRERPGDQPPAGQAFLTLGGRPVYVATRRATLPEQDDA